jgi:hypothetical protein
MRALEESQLRVIGASATPMAVDVGAIELAGGSVRCMIAGVHLARRDEQPAGDARFPGASRPAEREEALV